LISLQRSDAVLVGGNANNALVMPPKRWRSPSNKFMTQIPVLSIDSLARYICVHI
jgi:hypothetical protein